MKITVCGDQSNTGVYLQVSIDGLPDTLDFYRAGASPLESYLLMEEVRKKLRAHMEEVRTVAYLRGWRDAKAKKPKAIGHTGRFDILEWEREEAGL
jgi:hypothetical protein